MPSFSRSRPLFLAGSLLFFTSWPLRAAPADSVGDLIDRQKEADDAWLAERSVLPTLYLFGDAAAIQIYSPDAEDAAEALALCESLDLETLVDLSGPPNRDGRVDLNTSLSVIREPIRRACLVRPGDDFLAIFDGLQTRVRTTAFFIKAEPRRCEQGVAYSLWMELAAPLEDPPLFYSTSLDLPEGGNSLPGARPEFEVVDDPGTLRRLGSTVKFIQDFTVTASSVPATNIDRLFHLRRARVGLEDAGLSNEVLIASKGDALETLLTAAVDPRRGSSRLAVDGIVDVNADGAADIAASVVGRDCRRSYLFEGTPEGFRPAPSPERSCACR